MHPESSGCHIYILYLYYIVHFSRQNFPLFHKRRTGKHAFCGFDRFCAGFAPTFHRLSTEKATELFKNRLLFFTAFPPFLRSIPQSGGKQKDFSLFQIFPTVFPRRKSGRQASRGAGLQTFPLFSPPLLLLLKKERIIYLFSFLYSNLLHFPQRG